MSEARFDLADLVGRPFAWGGRGPDAFDCWGLVREAHRRWHGVELPDYPSSRDLRRNARLMTSESERLWRPLERPEPGAVLVLSFKSIGCHVGFAISPTRFIHALDGQSVLIERMHRRIRVMGAYRYVG